MDDERAAPAHFTRVQTVSACWQALLDHHVEVLSLDHDLGEEGEAYPLVLRMVEEHVWPTHAVLVHSANPVGAQNMLQVLQRHAPVGVQVARLSYERLLQGAVQTTTQGASP